MAPASQGPPNHAIPYLRGQQRFAAHLSTSGVGDAPAKAKQIHVWLGLVPSQNSTGGKASLGRITKRGDDYLRTLLIQGAKSAVMSAGKLSVRISQWLAKLKDGVVWQKAVVALANKNARILWAVLRLEAAGRGPRLLAEMRRSRARSSADDRKRPLWQLTSAADSGA